MSTKNIYKGHRYVPLIMGVWDVTKEYEGLSIVQWEGDSFTSKKKVPVGTPILNEDFWVVTGNYNAQIENYRRDVREVQKDVVKNTTEIEKNKVATELALSKKVNNDDFLLYKNDTLNSLNKKPDNIVISKTYLIGSSGDFQTLNQALEYLSQNHLTYKKGGLKIELRLMSGFVLMEQILLSGLDLGWVVITSVDPIVTIDRASLITKFGVENKYPAFGALLNATLPIIGTLFKMNTTGDFDTSRDGIYLENNSHVMVESGCGITHSGGYGLRAWDNCTITAWGANFSYSNERNCMISQGTRMSAPGINLSHANGRNGFRAYRGVHANLENADISNCAEVSVRISEASIVDIQNSNLSYSGLVNVDDDGSALQVYGSSNVYASGMIATNAKGAGVIVSSSSSVVVDNADLSNAVNRGLDAYGNGRVMAVGLIAKNCGKEGVRASSLATIDCTGADLSGGLGISAVLAEHGATIYAGNVNASNNGEGFTAQRGGRIIAPNANADDCDTGFNVYWEGSISAREATARNCSINAVTVSTGSEFKGTNGIFTGASQFGCYVFRGSTASIYGANFRKTVIDSTDDIVCLTGSTIQANESIGGKSLEINTVSTHGTIFA